MTTTATSVQCQLNKLKSGLFVLRWLRVNVIALAKTGFFSVCAKSAVVLGGFAWSRDLWYGAVPTIAEFTLTG